MGAASAPTPYIWSTRVPVWMYGELTSGSTHRDPHWRDYVPKEAAVKTTDLDAFHLLDSRQQSLTMERVA